jgi:heterogeneous nuclear ribonucleoprotein F/H
MAGRYINLSMDTAAATFNGVTQSKYCLKMSGLPFRATEQEMKDFFQPDAECQSVKVILNRDGRPSGDAIASFEDEEALEKAMVKDREHLGSRFVVLSKYDETNNGSMNGGTSAGGNFVIRMGGLPYKAKVKEIIEWFGPDVECLRVRILRSRDNRPSGEALAEFATKEEAENAMLKNKEYLGERFVVLTRQDF